MIYISCGVSQDFVIETLEGYKGEVSYKYEGKKGIKMEFSTDTDNFEMAAGIAKQVIKSTQVGSILYFQITDK